MRSILRTLLIGGVLVARAAFADPPTHGDAAAQHSAAGAHRYIIERTLPQTANDVPARTVHYADLNLNSQAGVAILYKRIRNAAEEVCGNVDSRRLEETAIAKACVNRAIFSSVHLVDNPRLTSEYRAHFGVAKPIDLASAR